MDKAFLEKHWFKGSLVLVLIFAIFFINNYLVEKNRLAREQVDQKQAQLAQEQKLESERQERDFDAKQRDACLAIYKQESTKWNNVNTWRYEDVENKCYIRYKDGSPKTDAQCDSEYKDADGKVIPLLFMEWALCKDGLFERSF